MHTVLRSVFAGLNTALHIGRVGQNHIYGVYTVFLAGKSPNIRLYTVYILMVLVNPTYGRKSCHNFMMTRGHHTN